MGVLIADYTNSNIVHFTHDGVFVDTIPVPSQPSSIALIPNGLIAISNWVENQVCMINLTSKQVVGTLEIYNACAICCHEQSDSILVGRCLRGYCTPTRKLACFVCFLLHREENQYFLCMVVIDVCDSKSKSMIFFPWIYESLMWNGSKYFFPFQPKKSL